MRNSNTPHDQINKIRDRTIMCLFKARRSRLQNISKDNLRIYNKIATQKSNYSSENRSQSYRSVHDKSIENERRMSCKGSLLAPTGESLTNITNISATRPISGIRNSKVTAQKPDMYSLPSISKDWNFTSVISEKNENRGEDLSYKNQLSKFKETEKIQRAWTRLKSKYKLAAGIVLLS